MESLIGGFYTQIRLIVLGKIVITLSGTQYFYMYLLFFAEVPLC